MVYGAQSKGFRSSWQQVIATFKLKPNGPKVPFPQLLPCKKREKSSFLQTGSEIPDATIDLDRSDLWSQFLQNENQQPDPPKFSPKAEKTPKEPVKDYTEPAPTKCKLCQKNYLQYCCLKLHIIATHLKEDVYTCRLCNYGTRHLTSGMINHMKNHHPGQETEFNRNIKALEPKIKKFLESMDNGTFQKEDVPISERWKVCQECGQNPGPDRRNHSAMHLEEKMFQCPLQCKLNGHMKLKLVKAHIKKAHPSHHQLRPIDRRRELAEVLDAIHEKCFPIPPPAFEGLSSKLSRSALRNSGILEYPIYKVKESPFACHLCGYEKKIGKTKAHRQTIRHHVYTHLEAHLFKCLECPEVLGVRSQLEAHVEEAKHPSKEDCIERALMGFEDTFFFLNQICFPKFEWTRTEKVSNCYCRLCEKYYAGRQGLQDHIMFAHLMKDSYLCSYCDFSLSTKPTVMKAHILKEHPGKEIAYTNERKKFKEELEWWLSYVRIKQ